MGLRDQGAGLPLRLAMRYSLAEAIRAMEKGQDVWASQSLPCSLEGLAEALKLSISSLASMGTMKAEIGGGGVRQGLDIRTALRCFDSAGALQTARPSHGSLAGYGGLPGGPSRKSGRSYRGPEEQQQPQQQLLLLQQSEP